MLGILGYLLPESEDNKVRSMSSVIDVRSLLPSQREKEGIDGSITLVTVKSLFSCVFIRLGSQRKKKGFLHVKTEYSL